MVQKKLLLLLPVVVTVVLAGATHASTNGTVEQREEELVQAETKDGQLEIIKRIKKVNPDGSYTIGYEADDGSFKIESRDVLGNVKGTYGFVDDRGEIKRVSYSTSNASDPFGKNQATAPSLVHHFPAAVATSVVQRIPSKTGGVVPSTTGTTTRKPVSSTSTSTTTARPPPRVLLQRPSQIGRPDVVPQQEPATKQSSFFDEEREKPVTEEASDNILRRQLAPGPRFDAQEHVFRVQQALGHNDMSDIYNDGASVTNRPLFTTARTLGQQVQPRFVLPYSRTSTTELGVAVPTSTTTTTTSTTSTIEPIGRPTTVPAVVQIPATRPHPSVVPLVAVRRHPFQQGTVLVPLSQVQDVDDDQEVYDRQQQQEQQQVVEIERQQLRTLRPLAVRVDEDGYVRPMVVKEKQDDRELTTNDIDGILPPVSTREFQILLQHLSLRQKRLERISELTDPNRSYHHQQRQLYRSPPERRTQLLREAATYEKPYFVRRSAGRQLYAAEPEQSSDEYLPANVREMLLLRMLKLAMNPALPVQEDEEPVAATATTVQYRRAPVRNVEILGEERDELEVRKRGPVVRAKRYNEEDMLYME